MEPWKYEDVKKIKVDSATDLMDRFVMSPQLIASFKKKAVVDSAIADKLGRTSITPHEAVQEILNGIQDVKRFVNFCLVLIEMKQEYLVTEVMGLTVKEVHAQRDFIDGKSEETAGACAGHLTSPNTKDTGSSLPLWDPENPDQQTPLPLHPKLKNVLTDHILDLADTLDLNEEVWRGLESAKVIQKADMERIKLNKTKRDQLYELFDYLQKKPLWKFHAFLRVIVKNDQEAGVTIIGLNPKHYKG